MENFTKTLSFLLVALCPHLCLAAGSGELYTSASYGYGRFEARARFPAGDGVIGSFFLWKAGSDQPGAFWNELDFEKLNADCHIESNAIYGNPSTNHNQRQALPGDPCGAYHTYAYEWTADAIVWLVDGVEVRRETGAIATAFAQNAGSAGMALHFNVWPGDASFGGNFSPSILPVHQYIDWVQYSAYKNGAFAVTWREDFAATTTPAMWLTGTWNSPKNLSTNTSRNVNFMQGVAVISLTNDNALGPAGAMPNAGAGGTSAAGASGVGGNGSGGSSGMAGSAGRGGTAGMVGSAGMASIAGAAGSPGAAGGLTAGGAPGTSGAAAVGGAAGAVGSAGNQALAGAGGALSSGSAGNNVAGAPNGATPATNGSSCSFGRSPLRSDASWALCLLMTTFVYRRVRRRQGA